MCSVPITPTANSGVGGVKSYAQRLHAKGMTSAEVVSVNMHKLGESFVEKVSDVRRRATVDGQAAAPGRRVAGADIFFIPEIHFAGETPELDDEGWGIRYGRSYGAESV